VVIRAKLHADGLNTVKFVRIDVTDLATIQAAKEIIDKEEGKLDILVNNAGTFSSFFLINFPIQKLISKLK
jgi:NAD(P)-dependent dehydrogenase (short-subunit alcohol dehydrogenase family)